MRSYVHQIHHKLLASILVQYMVQCPEEFCGILVLYLDALETAIIAKVYVHTSYDLII